MLLPAQIAISGPKYAGDIHPFFRVGPLDRLFSSKTIEKLWDLGDTTGSDSRQRG
jgi:hypothetical protein